MQLITAFFFSVFLNLSLGILTFREFIFEVEKKQEKGSGSRGDLCQITSDGRADRIKGCEDFLCIMLLWVKKHGCGSWRGAYVSKTLTLRDLYGGLGMGRLQNKEKSK